MTASDNPASRLHELLERFDAASAANVQVTDAWASALAVPIDETPRAVARASNLLNEVEQAVLYLNQPRQQAMVTRFLPRWSKPFFPLDRAWTHGSHDLVDDDALAALGSLGDTMSSLVPEGVLPADDTLIGLRQSIEGAIDAVRADGDLPSVLRVLMLQRLYDVLWAVDHLEVAGPGGVKAASERLIGAVLLSEPTESRRPLVVKVMSTVGKAWAVFLGVPEAQGALEGWTTILDALPPGSG